MAKVTHVKKARKSRRKYGVRRGHPYFWWKLRRKGSLNGVTHYSLTPPKQSQLTLSPYKRAYWLIAERVYGVCDTPAHRTLLENRAHLAACAQEFRDLAQQQRDGVGNLRESLRSSPTGLMMLERAEACGYAADLVMVTVDQLGDAGTNDDPLVTSLLSELKSSITPPR